MMILLLVAIGWVLVAGFAWTLFAVAADADRRTGAMLRDQRTAPRPSRNVAA